MKLEARNADQKDKIIQNLTDQNNLNLSFANAHKDFNGFLKKPKYLKSQSKMRPASKSVSKSDSETESESIYKPTESTFLILFLRVITRKN